MGAGTRAELRLAALVRPRPRTFPGIPASVYGGVGGAGREAAGAAPSGAARDADARLRGARSRAQRRSRAGGDPARRQTLTVTRFNVGVPRKYRGSSWKLASHRRELW